ncbi:MAG: hypothetical protein WD940_01630 [Patescibacteria group bacterium]
MKKKTEVLQLACIHSPHTHQVRVECQSPKVVFSSCEECARKFYDACLEMGGAVIKPKNLL